MTRRLQVFHLNNSGSDTSLNERGQTQTSRLPASAVTIGNFDGVHIGHQRLIALLNQHAKARALTSCALTFEPHPREFFSAKSGVAAPPRITTLRAKLRALQNCGLDMVCVARFNADMASLTPTAFLDQVLHAQLNAKLVLVGDDFRFGAGRAGDFDWLQQTGKAHGIDVIRMDTLHVTAGGTTPDAQAHRYSSSAVRQSLAEADFLQVERLLGRPYTIEGHVLHGRKLGRSLGFPTLNLSVGPHRPALQGVFVVQVHGLKTNGIASKKPWPGVASLGTRPAVEQNGRFLLEVHCLDWQGDAYGQCVSVEFIHKLRGEANYDSLEALTKQISLDTLAAREHFNL